MPPVLERVEEVVDGGQRRAGGGDEQVPALEPRAPGRAVLHHPAHEQAVALGQADRGAHAPGGARRSEREPEPRPTRAGAGGERLGATAHRGVGRQREDQAALDPDRVEARAAGPRRRRAGRRRSRAAAARCARSSRRCGARAARGTSGPVAETRPNVARSPRPPGLASANTGSPIPTASSALGLPRDRLRVARLDRDGGEVEVGVRAGDAAVLGAAVGERDRDLLAAEHVRVGQDGAGGGDHAGPAPPAAAEADDRGADGFGCA